MDRLALFQRQKIEKNQLESKLLDEMNFACLSERIKFLKNFFSSIKNLRFDKFIRERETLKTHFSKCK